MFEAQAMAQAPPFAHCDLASRTLTAIAPYAAAYGTLTNNCVLRQPFAYYAIQFDRFCVLRIAYCVLQRFPPLEQHCVYCVLRIAYGLVWAYPLYSRSHLGAYCVLRIAQRIAYWR